jgi:hypothetical protein
MGSGGAVGLEARGDNKNYYWTGSVFGVSTNKMKDIKAKNTITPTNFSDGEYSCMKSNILLLQPV